MNFSQKADGVEISTEELAEIFLDLQSHNAKCLNLVTPTPHLPFIIEALSIAKREGFDLPVVYNTSSYESVDILRLIEGVVDVYLADLKYADDETGMALSKVNDYFTVAKSIDRNAQASWGIQGVVRKNKRFNCSSSRVAK